MIVTKSSLKRDFRIWLAHEKGSRADCVCTAAAPAFPEVGAFALAHTCLLAPSYFWSSSCVLG